MRIRSSLLAFFVVPAIAVSACGSTVDSARSNSGAGGGTSTTGDGGATATTTTTSSTGGSDAGPDVDNGAPSDVYPAPHPEPPRVVTLGGPVLDSPTFVPVFFQNDDTSYTAQIADFTTKMGASAWWKANTEEYGVGAATGGTPVQLDETAVNSLDDSDIQTWLAGKLNADDPAFPPPEDGVVYSLFYPASTEITLQSGGQTSKSCWSFGGYHNNITLDAAHGSKHVAYVVVPRCNQFGPIDGIDATTGTASHEYLESATDPFPEVDPAYAQVDNAHIYWLFTLGGGETADMCAQNPGAFVMDDEIGYTVQRSWSNVAAKASHDPCVPAISGESYFNSAPVLPDSLKLGGATMKGIHIPVGESRTIEVDLFSDGPTSGPWEVKAVDGSALQGGQPNLDFTFDRTSGVNGEKLHLTIAVLSATPYKAETFLLISQLGEQRQLWVGLVGN
jgi:hypothetical protein